MSPALIGVRQIVQKICNQSAFLAEFFFHSFVFSAENLLMFIRKKSLRTDRLQVFSVLIEQDFQLSITTPEILDERGRSEREKEKRKDSHLAMSDFMGEGRDRCSTSIELRNVRGQSFRLLVKSTFVRIEALPQIE